MRHLWPAGKRRKLNVGPLIVFLVFHRFMFSVRRNVTDAPPVHATIPCVFSLEFVFRTLEFQFARLGNIDFQTLFHGCRVFHKRRLIPEFPLRQRLHLGDGVVFQDIPNAESDHGDVPLPVVAIHRSFLQNFGGQVLRRGGGRLHDLAVRLAHSHIIDSQILGSRRVSKNKLPQLLNASLALNANHRRGLAQPGAIILEAHKVVHAQENHGFPGCVRLGDRGRRRSTRRPGRRLSKKAEKWGGPAQNNQGNSKNMASQHPTVLIRNRNKINLEGCGL